MTGDPRHDGFKRGEGLARELHEFLKRELDSEEEIVQALLGAFDYLDRRTRLVRDPNVQWPEAHRRRRDE